MQSDSTPQAAAMQYAIYRAMTPSARLQLAMDLSDVAREFAKAGLRSQHPELDEREVNRELLRLLYGFSATP